MGGTFNTIANVGTLGAWDALDVTGEKAKNAALGAQSSATGQANNALTSGYQQQTAYLDPYNQAGKSALNQLSGGNIGANYRQSPGFQSQLAAGQTAINNGMAARGLGNSGAALKALTSYSQDQANQDYQQYYNNESNRLNTLAGLGSGAATNMANAAGAYGSNLSSNYMGLGNATAAANLAQSNNTNALIGQGIGAAAMFSDARLKTNFKEITEDELKEMKSILKGFHFNYLKDEHGEGDWMGVMAQDLEKSKIGKLLVIENAEGLKTIDTNKVLSMFLAYFAEAA